jgi:hypothetical protein
MRLMRFGYYARLSRAEQAIYRRSDALTEVRLPSARALRGLVPPVEQALLADDRRAVERATDALVQAVLADLGAPPVVVKVLATRPVDDEGSELHGLYVVEEGADEGKPPVLRVWMRTTAKRKPVKLRTFVRTVMHEVVHHLDFTIHDLAPSFHCEGFFKREAHLSRQLLDDPAARLFAGRAPPVPEPPPPAKQSRTQLGLFDDDA